MFEDLPEYADVYYKIAERLMLVANIGVDTVTSCHMPHVIVQKNYNHMFVLKLKIDVTTGKVQSNELDINLDIITVTKIEHFIGSYEKLMLDLIRTMI